MNQEAEKQHREAPQPIHIFVDGRKYEFATETITGGELKAAVGARPTDGLYEKVQGKLVEIPNEQVIELRNGEHFSIVPDGTVS